MCACSRRYLCTHACSEARRWSSRNICSRCNAEEKQRRLGFVASHLRSRILAKTFSAIYVQVWRDFLRHLASPGRHCPYRALFQSPSSFRSNYLGRRGTTRRLNLNHPVSVPVSSSPSSPAMLPLPHGMKKFHTNRTGAPLVASIAATLILISMLSSQNVKISDPTFLGIALMFLLIVLDTIFGNFIVISSESLSTVDWFFIKQSVNPKDIVRISYSPQFIGGMGAKMLTVYSRKDNQLKALNIGSSHFFSRKTIAAIIKEIRDRNPNVEMDQSAENLMHTYAK